MQYICSNNSLAFICGAQCRQPQNLGYPAFLEKLRSPQEGAVPGQSLAFLSSDEPCGEMGCILECYNTNSWQEFQLVS